MKRVLLQSVMVMFVVVSLLATAFGAGKGTASKGRDVTVTGELTCAFCKLANPTKSCEKGCCDRCIESGSAPLLTDAKGNQYILLSGEHETPVMTPERYGMIGGKVNVKGLLVKGKGVQAIYVKSMEKK